MEHGIALDIVLFAGLFLFGTGLLQIVTKKYNFPYTVALLGIGFIAQLATVYLGIETHLNLSTTAIYFIILPLLLFESAMHLNAHQFRLQFKTITFLATAGLMISIFTIGFLLSLILGMPFGVALLFGALISATDPIAVLALFKQLKAPKRLALIADGESMFNDATAVIVFRLIAGVVVVNQTLGFGDAFTSAGRFLIVFGASILLGVILGYLTSVIIEKIKDEPIVETTLTISLALGSFVMADHFLHLSGVITTVIAGIIVGNIGKTKISGKTISFMNNFWEYIGFLAVSLVFFFASFQLDFGIFLSHLDVIGIVLAVVLLARSLSVYVSFFITNRLKIFKDEPNIPLSWQHIINWGGLRGVIPLVLVYSIPDEFIYKQELLIFTLATFLFTVFVNGMTIKYMLKLLRLNIPEKKEQILEEERKIFELENARSRLQRLPKGDFDNKVISILMKKIDKDEEHEKDKLSIITSPGELERTLRIQAIEIERGKASELFRKGYMSENVYHDFEAELDLQQDALEYPSLYFTKGQKRGGRIDKRRSFRKELYNLRRSMHKYPFFQKFWKLSEENLIEERFSLLKVRVTGCTEVIEHFEALKKYMKNNKVMCETIKEIIKHYKKLHKMNQEEINQLAQSHNKLLTKYREKLLSSLVYSH